MHIGFIMDGNRRWATNKWLLKILGHTSGVDNVENILELSLENKIDYVSMWVLAKKNIEERDKFELEHLYDLIRTRVIKMLPKLIEKWIKFETVGDLDLLPKDVKEILEDSINKTVSWNKMTFILAVWYGWQDEIIRWVKDYINRNIEEIKNNHQELLKKLNEKEFSNYIDSGKFPAPDLIVRTWWDCRLSWYFLYASEYSEYYFTETYWPDFWKEEFIKAINSLKNAKRNFWK